MVSCSKRVMLPSCWNTSGDTIKGSVGTIEVRSSIFMIGLPGGQAGVAIFCMIFCTFSSSVALVKGLTM